MLQFRVPDADCCATLEERVQRQSFVLAKLERDGYPCEVQAARRILRSLEARLSAARRRSDPPDGR